MPSSPTESLGTSIDEQLQLQRIFRLLAFDIPLKHISQKLEKLDPGRMYNTHVDQSTGSTHRCSVGDVSAKRECYLRQREKFTSTLQDEVSYGRELVTARFQIVPKTLQAVYERLGYPVSSFGKSHADDMIWQVNDNLDGSISFDEFVRSYMRARSDRSGMEPAELFYLTCFLMFDKECSGKILLDDTMNILYLKYGDAMEQEMQLHFGEFIDSGAHVITFMQYREATTRRIGQLIDLAIGSRAAKFAKKM